LERQLIRASIQVLLPSKIFILYYFWGSLQQQSGIDKARGRKRLFKNLSFKPKKHLFKASDL
jgi:hypothetical protein